MLNLFFNFTFMPDGIMGGGTAGVVPNIQTPEELQAICVHVWRDDITTDTQITQRCIRCGLERIFNK